MQISGVLGTRADLIVDIVMIASAALPFLLMAVIRLAKKERYELHRWLQFILFGIVALLVAALEMDIRFGGLDAVMAKSPYHDSTELFIVLLIHLIFAISSAVLWWWLIVKSEQRYPVHFTFPHKKYGMIVFVDIVLAVITGWILYSMVFIS